MHTSNVVVAWAQAVQQGLLDALAEVGVDPRELSALTLVGQRAGCSLEWLHQRVGLTQSGTVRLVDRLSARGLVERIQTPGRGVPLRLTDAGRRVLDAWGAARDRAVAEMLAGLEPTQRDQLVAAMTAALTSTPRDRRTADATCGACTWPACGSDCPVDRSVRDESGT